MATRIGSHAQRLAGVRALRAVKGRRDQERFIFEGATLLADAVAAAFPISALYATQAAYDSALLVRELDERGTPTFLIEEAACANISDLATPSGIVAVARMRLLPIEQLFARGSPILVLGDVNDPANAGTLLRSADAFGCAGVVFGRLGVDPYHPKVVRGSMGAVFRLPLCVADPQPTDAAAAVVGLRMVGLAADGVPITEEGWAAPIGLVVGHERRGLGRWKSLCERVLAIPMSGRVESLSAAVAGSIALYEASVRRHCQESTAGLKSQDYRP